MDQPGWRVIAPLNWRTQPNSCSASTNRPSRPGSAGEIILSALRRCERHLSVGYLIADAVKRCGRLVQSPGFSRQPLQIFRLFRAFTSMKEETAGVYSSCSPIEQTRLQIAREGGAGWESSAEQTAPVSFQIRRKVGSGQFRNGQSRCF